MVFQFKTAPLEITQKLVSARGILDMVGNLGIVLLGPMALLFSPREYVVSAKGISIRTTVGSHLIPKAIIEAVEAMECVPPGVRITWFGGLCGYAGLFALADGSIANVYATRWDHMVRVNITNAEPYYLSPVQPRAFVESVSKLILES